MTTLTFGIIIHWFNILRPHDKSDIISHLLKLWNTSAIKEKQSIRDQDINRIVINCLKILNKYRNACAHGEVLNTVRCKNIVVKGHTTNANLLSKLLFTKDYDIRISGDSYNKGQLYSCIMSIILLTDDHYQLMKFMRRIYLILKNREEYLKNINKSNLIKLDVPDNIMEVLKKLIIQETEK